MLPGISKNQKFKIILKGDHKFNISRESLGGGGHNFKIFKANLLFGITRVNISNIS